MAPSNKPRRAGRTLRRARGGTTNTPLQVIEGNTVTLLSSLNSSTSSNVSALSKENASTSKPTVIKNQNGKGEGSSSVKYQQAIQILEEMEREGKIDIRHMDIILIQYFIVERRCQEIDMEVARKVEELHSEVSVLRMLLPTAVQTMSPHEFLYEYDGKVTNVLQKTKEQGYIGYANLKQSQISSPTSTREVEGLVVSTVRSKQSRRSDENLMSLSTPRVCTCLTIYSCI